MAISSLKAMVKSQVKQLRKDAIKLETVARHLRQQAKQLADQQRADERSEKARVNFYSKPANIDPSITLTPDFTQENK
jgi:hypothetical protein